MTNEEFQQLVLEKLDNLDGRLQENIVVTKGLVHQSELQNTQFDNLMNVTARIEGHMANSEKNIDRMAGDITFLVRKTAEHEDDIRNLKLIK
ncbi:putative nuclease with TOPRIM domain [Sporomusaceae bacterium BoRhaA]|uniref:hypothetical protein n=1 Tax=Pelorhabdus rhamnosifermentans TaxID=2772457 RepID=UPI001C063767|nr:hypothetical protein [Pelorhabdus rhamnosifermentans]MBU2700613.1 putative nuclease with TOPRIM domain [Pelorhabdus rhamnosifermentans]